MILIQVVITPNLTLVGSTADFIKILEQSKFPIGLYWWLALSTNRNANQWEIHLLLIIKSAEYLTSLKFGVMITWVNTIVKIFFVAIATSVN